MGVRTEIEEALDRLGVPHNENQVTRLVLRVAATQDARDITQKDAVKLVTDSVFIFPWRIMAASEGADQLVRIGVLRVYGKPCNEPGCPGDPFNWGTDGSVLGERVDIL